METESVESRVPWSSKVLQTYVILVVHASRHETTTYSELGNWIWEDVRSINGVLAPINRHCKRKGLPLLGVLVLSSTGQPGLSYPGPRESIPAETERAYAHDWLAEVPPTIEQLTES